MTTEVPGTGDPARSMSLLWRSPGRSGGRPGPRPAVDVERIVAAGVRLADADGLESLSMRRVAAELGVATMTLYGHVPGKGELADLMRDAVLGELYPDGPPAGNWRSRLDAVARANRDLYARHPWAARATGGRPPLGPHRARKYELELRAVDGLGLSEVQMDLLVGLVDGFVRSTVAGSARGTTKAWWPAMADYADRFLDAERFPTLARVGRLTLAVDGPDHAFEFGLERLLDGIGVLILDAAR